MPSNPRNDLSSLVTWTDPTFNTISNEFAQERNSKLFQDMSVKLRDTYPRDINDRVMGSMKPMNENWNYLGKKRVYSQVKQLYYRTECKLWLISRIKQKNSNIFELTTAASCYNNQAPKGLPLFTQL